MANTLKLYRNGAVGFIGWLGLRQPCPSVLESGIGNHDKADGNCSNASGLMLSYEPRIGEDTVLRISVPVRRDKVERPEAVNLINVDLVLTVCLGIEHAHIVNVGSASDG